MSVTNWIVLATQESINGAEERSGMGECWFHGHPNNSINIEFGDANDTFDDGRPLYNKLAKVINNTVEDSFAILEECYPFISGDKPDLNQISVILKSRPELRVWFYSE